MRVCDAAVLVLRETNNPAVGWGDAGLLHMIANRAETRMAHKSWRTEKAVLDALTRQPGELISGYMVGHTGGRERRVRCFWLPEHAPSWLTETAASVEPST